MAGRRFATIFRLGKPIMAGLALAYLVTAFVDKPMPVHFQPGNPFAAQQSAIVEPETALVSEKNIMKLGSPLSILPDQGVPETNPLAALEKTAPDGEANATSAEAVSVPEAESAAGTAPAVQDESSPGGAAPAVRGEVDTIPIPALEAP